VAEIAAASGEQNQGIGQINTAVTEMDKVTQQNAATAEESASASEEMNAQAEQMKAFVDELVAMVGGGAQRQRRAAPAWGDNPRPNPPAVGREHARSRSACQGPRDRPPPGVALIQIEAGCASRS
jgi:hypothetical protein